ncbi:hypothetical protein AVEN_23290-1 [Araneus ventricosus]|uniref:Uncharacterized protein n=1 Tax=Araneus ventricosus TaxID=182803 RepID=A0A4Y2GGZ9_ARAVE|nr:hypothetical protein AVEN_23290-1 [Araneus ventricosus]
MRGHLKNDLLDDSDTEVGVLIVITGHGRTSPPGGTFSHWSGVSQPTPLLCPSWKREPAYLSGDFSSTYSWSHPPMGEKDNSQGLILF